MSERQTPPEFYYSPHDYGKVMRLVLPPEKTHYARHLEELQPAAPELHEYNYRLAGYEAEHQWENGKTRAAVSACWIYQLIR